MHSSHSLTHPAATKKQGSGSKFLTVTLIDIPKMKNFDNCFLEAIWLARENSWRLAESKSSELEKISRAKVWD